MTIEWKVPDFGRDEIVIDRGHAQSLAWSNQELETLKLMYSTAKNAEILKALPQRNMLLVEKHNRRA